MASNGSRLPQSVSRENSWSNEPSAVDSSLSSDHRTISEVMSEPEIAKGGPDVEPQVSVNDSRPVPTGITELQPPHVTIDDTCKPVLSDISLKSVRSADVIEQPVAASQLPQIDVSPSRAETAVTDNNTVAGSQGDEVCREKTVCNVVSGDGVGKRTLLDDAVDSKYEHEESDSEATPKNERSVQEDDISVHLDETVSENRTSSTLSSHGGMKTSPVHSEFQPQLADLHNSETSAFDVEPVVRPASPEHAASDAVSPEDNKDLKQSLGSCGENISTSSHSTRSRQDVPCAAPPGSRPASSDSTSSRHSASGASRDGSGSGKAALVHSDRSDRADSISSRSVDAVHSSASSKAHTVDSDRSVRASSSSNDMDIISRQVSGKAESVQGSCGSMAISVHSSISGKTYSIDSEGSGVHSAGRKSQTASLHHVAEVAVPDSTIHRTGSEVEQREDAAAADTDDDVADLEVDLSSHAKPAEKVLEIVDKVSAALPVTVAEDKDKQEARMDAEAGSIKDERMPEELDSDLDFNEDAHGWFHSATDAQSVLRNTSEPQSDTSESRSGRKSDDLHRIISKVAAAVESFVTEDERTSEKIGNKDEEHLPDDRCQKVAAGATQSLLNDAIDQMLAVRNHKISTAAAASNLSTVPAVPLSPLSPSALSDNVKSTLSSSSNGQVLPLLFINYACY